MMRSLRSRVVGGMVLLIGLVFVIALLGVNAIRALDESVDHELSLLLETTDLGNGLISSVASEVRSAEQYLLRPAEELRLRVLEQGDSAYAAAAPLPRARLPHHRRPLHRQSDRRQPGQGGGRLCHGARLHRPGTAR